MPDTLTRPAAPRWTAPVRPRRPRRTAWLWPAWPLTLPLLLYPLWWALGLGVLIFFLAAVPMTVAMLRWRVRGRAVRFPPGFTLWLLFLAVVLIGGLVLGADPAGTVPATAGSRVVAYAYRFGGYLALTVLLLYAGNLTERQLPRRRLVGLLGWLFVVTVAGGLLGMVAGEFEFNSPVELMLPEDIRRMGFVQSLVHPSAAQVMDLIGEDNARPSAPWGYTNTWGNNLCLLAVWFVAATWGSPHRVGPARALVRFGAVVLLAAAVAPVVYSLNRGLWIGLGVMALYVAVRLAGRGRVGALAGIVAATGALTLAIVATPLGDVVAQRLDNGRSNGIRIYLTEHAVAGLAESPFVGFGSTRTTQGGRNSIAVGESDGCERCGNFTVGGNGQLWQLLFAHGLLGTATYLGFFAYGLWRWRRDTTPIGLAAGAMLVSTFAAMFWYNALVTPLALTFCGYALLWRNQEGSPR